MCPKFRHLLYRAVESLIFVIPSKHVFEAATHSTGPYRLLVHSLSMAENHQQHLCQVTILPAATVYHRTSLAQKLLAALQHQCISPRPQSEGSAHLQHSVYKACKVASTLCRIPIQACSSQPVA